MSAVNGKKIGAKALAVLAMVAGVQACSSMTSSESLPGWVEPGQAIIQQRNDAVRGRLWVLTKDGVEVYDSLQRHRLAQIRIPGWVWVPEPYTCAPDLALGPRGEAVITSNIMPTLWRVDPDSLAITRHEIAVAPETDRDFGFTGLTYSTSLGAYYGVAAFDGRVWRIDAKLQGAREPALNVTSAKACRLAG